jgi:hypothetical protein
MKRIFKASRVVALPKGWTYTKSGEANRLYFILGGELTYESRNAFAKIKIAKDRPVDLMAILRGEKPVVKEDWQAVEEMAAQSKLGHRTRLNRAALTRRMILSGGHFFAEDCVIKYMPESYKIAHHQT